MAKAFHVMVKPIGPVCNLACDYCYYTEKSGLYPGTSDFKMSDRVLEEYTRQYIEAQDVPEVTFGWQGGEPTMLGVEFFRKAVGLQKKYAGGKKISNNIQTNGTLLDDELCEFFAGHGFLVGLSMDGGRKIHDMWRHDREGNRTFDRVMAGLDLLRKHKVDFNSLTVVSRHNAGSPVDVYNALKKCGVQYMQFIPLVERELDAEGKLTNRVRPFSVQPEQFGRFLVAIFQQWVKSDVGKVFVQYFDTALGHWLGVPCSLCVFSKQCGLGLVMEHNGDLYACDHFVYPDYRLGNIVETPMAELVYSARQRQFGADKLERLPCYCQQCDVRFACNGGCPKHRFAITPAGDEGLNYLCRGLKHFFTHIDPYMRRMAELLRAGRPAAEIMRQAR
ncbi:MAG: anaerobic sulfatase maturase [Verrucomicrobia bacterium]|nr:anaerobic sulfatase maturase [Verrucomicrobiota bacterium]